MLHLCPGESSAATVHFSGIGGDALALHFPLPYGEVPRGLSRKELCDLEGTYFGDSANPGRGRGWQRTPRVQALALLRRHDELTLWFGSALWDQLNLIWVLDWFCDADLGATRLSLIPGDDWVWGNRLHEYWPKRHQVTPQELDLGRRAWEAFRAPAPLRITSLLDGGTLDLPNLAPALRVHLQTFPSARNGLSRWQELVLADLTRSKRRWPLMKMFGDLCFQISPRLPGDAWWLPHIAELSQGPDPLLLTAEGASLDPGNRSGPKALQTNRRIMDTKVKVTRAGREVVAGRRDWIAIHGIDAWLGGTHLAPGMPMWRWDEERGQLVNCGLQAERPQPIAADRK